MYIKQLEDRERVLTQNVLCSSSRLLIKYALFLFIILSLTCSIFTSQKVEELLTTVKETEVEVARWREACELEVEAANVEIGERDKRVIQKLLTYFCLKIQPFSL